MPWPWFANPQTITETAYSTTAPLPYLILPTLAEPVNRSRFSLQAR